MTGVTAGASAPAELFAGGTAAALRAAATCFDRDGCKSDGPFGGVSPAELAALAAAVEVFPEDGRGLQAALDDLGGLALRYGVDPAHPACAAHLQCPPLAAAVAADALVSAANQSLDSWDQGPIACHLEQQVIAALTARAGLDPGVADGVLTTGGTQSNLMGLLLARDAAARRGGREVAVDGLGPEASRYRILCSRLAHFSVGRAARVLGLGEQAVQPVAVDADQRLRLDALDTELARMDASGLIPVALVATAGTTDFGSIDPLPAMAERARDRGLWLHVDAAYGGALLFSDRHRRLLQGLESADSLGLDFHKLLWQPVACGAFLVRERTALASLDMEVAYLNPADTGEAGSAWHMPHLVGKSMATTRRFDALKLLVTVHAVGRRALGAMIDRTIALAGHAADLIEAHPALALAHRPVLSSVVFRYAPAEGDAEQVDRLNAAIRAGLLADGLAVVGRTDWHGRTHLKLTLLNPVSTDGDVVDLVELIARRGAALSDHLESRRGYHRP